MARIPRNTNRLGSRKCRSCETRRICYIPTDDAEYAALGEPGKLCGACLIAKRSEFITAEVGKVLSKHTAARHAFEGSTVRSTGNTVELVPPAKPGGLGVCGWMWVVANGFKKCFSHGCLDLSGSVYEDLNAIPGVSHAYFNYD
jgi:hypothetical protein